MLAIDFDTLQAINELVTHAKNHPVDFEKMQLIMEGKHPPLGDLPEYVCYVSDYRCVLTFEVHFNDQMFRHLSVSMPDAYAYPSPTIVGFLMNLFGFHEHLEGDIGIYQEEEVFAVNILEPVSPELTH